MSYVSKLDDEQVRDLLEIFTPNYTDLEYKISDEYIDINCRDSSGVEDNYVFRDFTVDIVDWMSNNDFEYIAKYRSKMLLWFGNQYAIDFLFYRY